MAKKGDITKSGNFTSPEALNRELKRLNELDICPNCGAIMPSMRASDGSDRCGECGFEAETRADWLARNAANGESE